MAGLGIEVIVQFEPLDEVVANRKFYKFLSDTRIPSDASLLVCLVTEGTSSPGGGLWWCEDQNNRWHEPLLDLYSRCFTKGTFATLISRFARRTVLQLACGVGLDVDGVDELKDWIYRNDVVDNVIAPTNLSFHPAQLLGFTVNLALLMYFQGRDIKEALPEAWLRDERARQHSDLLLLSSGEAPLSYVWSPLNRPFGQALTYCKCDNQGKTRWRHVLTGPDREDEDRIFCRFKCTTCSADLRMWLGSRQEYTIHERFGTTYLNCSLPVPQVNVTIELQPPEQAKHDP